MLPRELKDLRKKTAIMIAGGPLASIALLRMAYGNFWGPAEYPSRARYPARSR